MKNKHTVDYSEKILEVKDLRQYFISGTGKRRIEVRAVDGISFDIYKREVFGLVGESGCGKTTTGRSIMKLYNPTDGQVIYKGNVIGAGYYSNTQKIREIRRKAKFDILSHQPYKMERYRIKEAAKFELLEINNKMKVETAAYKEKVVELRQPLADYKLKSKTIQEQYVLEKNDLLHQFNLSKGNILAEGIIPVFKERKHYIHIVNARFKDKCVFINSLKIEKYDKDEQIRVLREELDEELVRIDHNAIKNLNKLGHDVTVDEFKELSREYKRDELADKKERIKVEKDELKIQLAELKEKYKKDVEEHKANSISKEEIKLQVNELKENHKASMAVHKEKKKEIKEDRSLKLQTLKEDYKANPEKYEVNKEEIIKIKEKRNEEVAVQKEEIRVAKMQNKLKEFPEAKEERLAKVEALKEEYALEQAKIEEEFKNKPRELKRELKKAKDQYQLDLEEIQSTKPSFTNCVSSIQMIFQDPISSLNPRMVVSDIIAEGLVVRGERNRAKNRQRVYDVLQLVGLDRSHATRYPHEFSGGQRQRIGVARAIIVNPDFIIADEPISALDVSIQAQVINLLNDLKERLGLTILFIAHDLSVVKYFSDRIAVMYMGKIVELASSDQLFENPLHPYTKSLLSAIPHPDPQTEKDRERFLYNPFMHDYSVDKPTMREITEGHFVYANDKEFAEYQKELSRGVTK